MQFSNEQLSPLSYNLVLANNVFEGLLYMHMNDPNDIRGCICESWDVSDDYLVWTFYLRSNVRYSNGNVCDAYSIADWFDHISTKYDLAQYKISNWNAADSHTFVVSLSEENPSFTSQLCQVPFLIGNVEALKKHGYKKIESALATGPYILESIGEEGGAVFSANKHYYDAGKHPVVEKFILTPTTENSMISGDCELFSEMEKYFNVMSDTAQNYALYYGLTNTSTVWINTGANDSLKNKTVREALLYFIDLDRVNADVTDGLGKITHGMWPEHHSSFVESKWEYNPQKGHELLETAGIKTSDIHFEINPAVLSPICLAVCEQLKEQGITIDEAAPKWHLPWQLPIVTNTYSYAHDIEDLWALLLTNDYNTQLCFQNEYDPELYAEMIALYESICETEGEEMNDISRRLTELVQNDRVCFGSISTPTFVYAADHIKGAVFFSNANLLPQLYYFVV